MDEIKIYKQSELTLQVSDSYDPAILDLDEWDRYLDILAEGRKYQIEAIRKSVIYLASGKYTKLEELILENYRNNFIMQEKYETVDHYYSNLQIRNKLFANIDLATGTGKSYVMFGIAQILMGIGLVDRVLLLCPSLTIERELNKKFLELTTNKELISAIPESAIISNPRIIDASSTIVKGDICIENIHAVYERTDSSIEDSITNGEKVLVLNDESHHIFNKIQGNTQDVKDIKKWKEFLISKHYNFKYIVGFTGTAYLNNDYFNDVIYRYSLRKAIDDRVVKSIDYVREDDTGGENEKFQKVLKNHQDNTLKYSKIKPLSILITSTIANANKLYNSLVEFLCAELQESTEAIKKKVIVVTSDKKHAQDVLKLPTVDNLDSSVEWIISVSMLTEGWDVKNVFQIVPWEDRAFNSKLLISQVLGRGLRLPSAYQSSQPKVTVFNHDSWSKNIVSLIDEVLELETRLSSTIITDKIQRRFIHNFSLYNINYTNEYEEVESNEGNDVYDFTRMEREGIKLDSQIIVSQKTTEFANVLTSEAILRNYSIKNATMTVSHIIDKLYDDFNMRNWEGKILKLSTGEYTQSVLPPRNEIELLVRKSMGNVGILGEELTEKNAYKILTAFNVLIRKKKKTIVTKRIENDVFKINTLEMRKVSTSVGNLKRGYSIFFSNDWATEILDLDNHIVMEKILEDQGWPISAIKEKNMYLLKTPLDVVITNKDPERKFVEDLCKKENAKLIDSWIKARDQGFYGIEYSYRYGGLTSKTRGYSHDIFNPDFFIKVRKNNFEYIIVIEVKADNDVSNENIAKYRYGINHFEKLNKMLIGNDIKQKYIFHFLSPNGYPEFFDYLNSEKLFEAQSIFRCDLENKLLVETQEK